MPLIIITLDAINNTNGTIHLGDAPKINFNIAGSALMKFGRDFGNTLSKQTTPIKELNQHEYAMSRVHKELIANTLQPQNIVLIVVESWGVSSDLALNEAIISPLKTPAVFSHYQLRQAVVPFYGATVAAELRELYAVRSSEPDSVADRNSLSSELAARGYETTALHGFMPSFFGREGWYPKAGFKSSLFIDELRKYLNSNESCGSPNFRGICDDEVPPLIKKKLMSKENESAPKFIYWLTLNSHYPYATPENNSKLECRSFDPSLKHTDVCNLSSTIYSTFVSLGKLITDPEIPPTRFIVVGDHSPPFLSRSKENIYDKQFVPMVELIPIKY